MSLASMRLSRTIRAPSRKRTGPKLAAEHLCYAFQEQGLPLVVLRFFSVYGPRQRPEMGYYKFIQALLTGETITVNGDGQQVRGNTYISDCVEATIAAIKAPAAEI